MSTYQTTLKDNSGNELLPKTVLKAIADDNGYYLDSSLSAADINVLKNGMLNNTVRHSNETPGTPPPINADQLNGHPDTYFATASEVSSLSYNNLGAVIDLTSYTSDPYETQTDGWLYLYAAGSSNQINVDVMGADDGSQYFILGLSSINYTTTTLYLKKGMRVKVTANTGSNNRIRFIPFVV